MTICIGAITARHELVTVSDQMLSMANGAFTAESVALKEDFVHQDWSVMFAGSDVGVVPSLVRRIEHALGDWSRDLTIDQVTNAAALAFQAERRDRAIATHLSSYGMDLDQFMANGENVFGEGSAAVLRERIERFELGCELIVAGHCGDDVHRTAHLLSVSDPGVVKEHNISSYWAIGSGSYLALCWLAIRKHNQRFELATVVYHLLEAKFTAEMAVGVGKETFVTVRRPDRSVASMEGAELDPYRQEWIRTGMPKLPARGVESLVDWLQNTRWDRIEVSAQVNQEPRP